MTPETRKPTYFVSAPKPLQALFLLVAVDSCMEQKPILTIHSPMLLGEHANSSLSGGVIPKISEVPKSISWCSVGELSARNVCEDRCSPLQRPLEAFFGDSKAEEAILHSIREVPSCVAAQLEERVTASA